MSKAGLADLKTHLKRLLRRLRGEAPLEIRKATRRPKDIRASARFAGTTDSLAVLLEDRSRS